MRANGALSFCFCALCGLCGYSALFKSPDVNRTNALPPLLAGDEPPPFEIANAGGASALVLVCDHASHRVPRALHHLGRGPGQTAAAQRHPQPAGHRRQPAARQQGKEQQDVR